MSNECVQSFLVIRSISVSDSVKSFILSYVVATLIVCSTLTTACNPNSGFKSSIHPHRPTATLLPDETLFGLGKTSLLELKNIFDRINVIRPVGSSGHAAVKQFIIDFLTKLGMHVELDQFESKTPFGIFNFTNIVGTVDPTREQNLVLACHYDSKVMDNFYGSTDSALPCALILKIAESLMELIRFQKNTKLGLQVIFFDGEEAFEEWTNEDSLYGARHLATKWQSEIDQNGKTRLSRIDILVLLDLLGASSPTIPNYGLENKQAYQVLVHLEHRFRNLGVLKGQASQAYFGHAAYGFIQDDHIPFLEKGVQVLHLIPSPFPSVWHTPQDDAQIIDWNTSLDLLNIIEAFVRTYMHIIM